MAQKCSATSNRSKICPPSGTASAALLLQCKKQPCSTQVRAGGWLVRVCVPPRCRSHLFQAGRREAREPGRLRAHFSVCFPLADPGAGCP